MGVTPDTREVNHALWQQYIAPLGARYLTLFSAAENREDSEFYNRVIKPDLFDGQTYTALDIFTRRQGRDHVIAEIVASGAWGDRGWRDCEYFTNPMSVDHSTGKDRSPTDRVVFSKHVVFTFEFDRDEVEFLKEQLDWLPRRSKWRESPIGKLFQRCSEFVDFSGITVAWSGN